MNPVLICPQCQALLLKDVFNRPDLVPCPSCGVELLVNVFPAFFRAPGAVRESQFVVASDQASCFNHPQKLAVCPCDKCGRFLCALCDCELLGGHYCPSCLEAERHKNSIEALSKGRRRYDKIALALAIVPILFVYVTCITALLTLYVCFRYWNAPPGPTGRGRWKFVLAVFIALLELAAWGVFLSNIFK